LGVGGGRPHEPSTEPHYCKILTKQSLSPALWQKDHCKTQDILRYVKKKKKKKREELGHCCNWGPCLEYPSEEEAWLRAWLPLSTTENKTKQ
jgi:hypothetical protein